MRIAYVTHDFPYGPGDPFVAAEIVALSELGAETIVIPARVPARQQHVQECADAKVVVLPALSAKTMLFAAALCLMHPRRVAYAARAICSAGYGVRARRQNAAFFLKGLAVARAVQQLRVEHIHASSAAVPSTIAYVASLLSGIPWSCTTGWNDASERNMPRAKAATAAFIRVISARARTGLVRSCGSELNGRCTVVPPALLLPRSAHVAAAGSMRLACFVRGAPQLPAVLEAFSRLRTIVPLECDLIVDQNAIAAASAAIEKYRLHARVRVRLCGSHERLFAQMRNGEYGIVLFAGSRPQYVVAALLAGVASIATADTDELIDANCTIVVQRNPDEIAGAISALYSDSERRRTLAERAMLCAQSAFDARVNGRRLFGLMSGAV